ncbi:MAG: MgtC/SapB family protein [Clostridia bacterium]|nr:MgtC/SapB family protein [Clostridia bacterium]
MENAVAYLRDFSLGSMALRLFLALAAGGLIGYGRSKRERPAGFRTYMLISIGAAMSTLLALYQYKMLTGAWADTAARVSLKFDGSRMAAQVITGIGFLGAGIIVKAAHQQVNGLTTATGLFATVCIGAAAGLGFYEVVLLALLMIVLVLNLMAPLEGAFKRRLRNITLNVEFHSVEDIATITELMEKEHAHIFDIDIERTERKGGKIPQRDFYPEAEQGKPFPLQHAFLAGRAQMRPFRTGTDFVTGRSEKMLSIFDGVRALGLPAIVLKMVLSCLCGALIGLERSAKNRPAGLRAHILVCLGAAVASLTGLYLYLGLEVPSDISRISGQVISGLGFIGAGTIVITKKLSIKGLTTAAGLWTTGIIGLALGSGYYEIALIGCVLVLLAETWFARLGEHIEHHPAFTVELAYDEKTSLDNVLRLCKNKHMAISSLRIHSLEDMEDEDADARYTVNITLRGSMNQGELLKLIRLMPGVISIVVL